MKEGLLGIWNEEKGERDPVLPLDTSSWESMFLLAAGRPALGEVTL